MSTKGPRLLSKLCCNAGSDPDRQRAAMLEAIAGGSDVGETDKNGVTPLHFAVRFRNVGAVKFLIGHGADVNVTCKRSGATPLHRAVTFTGAPGTSGKVKERLEILELLLEAGADPDIPNRKGKRPVEYVTDAAALRLFGSSGGR